jgi:small subunit ribosomal protein S10e
MVIVSRKSKRTVYEYLLTEGVIVIKKVSALLRILTIHQDFALKEHKDTKVPNLHVWMLLKSLASRNYVELVYNWYIPSPKSLISP